MSAYAVGRAAGALVLAMLSLWLAAPAADWRAVPFGLPGVEQDFYAALAELAAGSVLAAWAVSRLPVTAWRFFIAVAVTVAAFAALECLYWFLTSWEYRVFARQWDGVKAAPAAAALAAVALLGLPAANDWPAARRIRNSRLVIGVGVAASFGPYLLQRTAFGASGLAQTLAFALLATTFFTGAAVSFSGVRPFGKARS